MSPEEKKNIAIAAVLSVAAVFVFWWVRPTQAIYTVDPASTDVANATGPANPAFTPDYMSYNVPPYNPGDLPPITYNIGGSGPIISDNSSGKGCCPGCAGDNMSITDNIAHYYSIGGMGSLAGAA